MVHLELELGHDKVPIKGKVIDNYKDVTTKHLGAGVRFVELDTDVLEKIESYLKEMQKTSRAE